MLTRRNRSIAVFAAALLLTLLTSWIWAWPSKADPGIPANGYVSQGKCYLVIGQGGFSQEVPCTEFNLAPAPVRKIVGGTGAACMVAVFLEQELLPACLGGFVGGIRWDF